MTLTLLTPPAAEPISLAEAKAFARIDTADEDTLLTALISTARQYVELVTGLRLVTQTWRLTLDALPESRIITLDIAPLQAVSAITLRDSADAGIVLAPSAYQVDPAAGRVLFSGPFQISIRPFAGIELDLVAGFGAASAVPEPLKQALRVLVATWYDDRGEEAPAVPPLVRTLLAPWRRRSL